MASRQRLVILGGGSGGISLAAKLRRLQRTLDISIVEPSDLHFYQAYWTLVAGGVGAKENTAKAMSLVMPEGVNWIRDAAVSVDPHKQSIQLKSGTTLPYDYLVVATGLKLDWNRIEGLSESLGKNGVCSIYDYNQVDYATASIAAFDGGQALFVMPPVPIKCAGAPQKIMYLAEHMWRKKGVRPRSEIHFLTAGKAMFGIPDFAAPLAAIVAERKIQPHFQHRLLAVDGKARKAIFEISSDQGEKRQQSYGYNLLHVVPPMSAHAFVAESGLAVESGDLKGWLAVDKSTLQHLRFANIFGIGDVTGIPNSKTAAAIRKQYPIVAQGIVDVMAGRKPSLSYDGYSSCPLVTEYGKVMLAEFGYDGKLLPSFPLDPTRPRRSYWHLKKDFLPFMYWKGMVTGLM